MTWFGWIFITDLGVSALIKVWNVGKPRKPLTGADAIGAVLMHGLYIAGALTIGITR